MPRKPTLIARQAKAELIRRILKLPSNVALPTMRELAGEFDLHPSTMFRMLRGLAAEGAIWQSPGGRFYSIASRKHSLKGAPLCFIGREMCQWFWLYQELLGGISEVCSANGSPLILLSAPSLVRQSSPTEPPRFAPVEIQKKELAALLSRVPRGCGGFILDHLWSASAIAGSAFPGGERVQLLAGGDPETRVVFPDCKAGATLAHKHLIAGAFQEAILVTPFPGDPAIDASFQAAKEELREFPFRELPIRGLAAEIKRLRTSPRKMTCLICFEDNIAAHISDQLAAPASSGHVTLLAAQGTGLISSPHPRLFYDYHLLGASAAAGILHGQAQKTIRPALLMG